MVLYQEKIDMDNNLIGLIEGLYKACGRDIVWSWNEVFSILIIFELPLRKLSYK